MKIWKYQIPLKVKSVIELPCDARILQVQAQGNDIVFWAIVNPHASVEERTFYVVGTGQSLPKIDYEDGITYRGTVQFDGFVWHIFVGV